ncbi:MAG: Glycosyltransferase family 10 (fucosyltransferase) [Elusimicrobia bacterium ADurb.Bin231]|nr:MAG: Glycosyltransferase family 10 (fucosyltransferase) [Elusimicrobia bacterium ADurb.Bin231]
MESLKDVKLFIDPSSAAYYGDVLFCEDDEYYNRDNCLAPWIFLKKHLESLGCEVHTADYLLNNKYSGKKNIYISLGMVPNYKALAERSEVILSAFFIFEPPVVAPGLYNKIKNISKYFKRVMMHTTGTGIYTYIRGVPNAHKFYWPQTEDGIKEELWGNKKRKVLALINGNKKPKKYFRELYSERINAIKYFGTSGNLDLYGYGWDKDIFYLPYFLNRKVIRKSYKGSVKSKYETLSNYKFAVCFENMILDGYITEKIFDCFFTGTVPIYLGAPDIGSYIPKNCFIDMRDFASYEELGDYLRSIGDDEINIYKAAAKNYLNSERYKLFTKGYFAETIEKMIKEDLHQGGLLGETCLCW